MIFKYVELGPDDESGEGDAYVPPGEPAYIAGKFVKKHPDSEEIIESRGLEYYYEHDSD